MQSLNVPLQPGSPGLLRSGGGKRGNSGSPAGRRGATALCCLIRSTPLLLDRSKSIYRSYVCKDPECRCQADNGVHPSGIIPPPHEAPDEVVQCLKCKGDMADTLFLQADATNLRTGAEFEVNMMASMARVLVSNPLPTAEFYSVLINIVNQADGGDGTAEAMTDATQQLSLKYTAGIKLNDLNEVMAVYMRRWTTSPLCSPPCTMGTTWRPPARTPTRPRRRTTPTCWAAAASPLAAHTPLAATPTVGCPGGPHSCRGRSAPGRPLRHGAAAALAGGAPGMVAAAAPVAPAVGAAAAAVVPGAAAGAQHEDLHRDSNGDVLMQQVQQAPPAAYAPPAAPALAQQRGASEVQQPVGAPPPRRRLFQGVAPQITNNDIELLSGGNSSELEDSGASK
ncbi:hypothetical protein CHLRE_13g579300v5 [Chlamydomonas reinhardtii]|uniref:Uncharacterized protein n=1 Tax=Chlamydomonas reinhardtii TaxID=3055 RepID=A0A2K3D093_CHLRE|nr:uncharacterized protein CHLRE_13g579300v5 [Chlamydomonas reinhardtii]PNW73947.1 hypothetical protein CHLRE_13g579300v5 [Chlamydomonas reinhardtii]